MSEKACGECSLCCKLLIIPELNKPENKWCQHCKLGRGCSIYDSRPAICQGFKCEWLKDSVDDHWYPMQSHMIIHCPPNDDGVGAVINIDPDYPNVWAEEPYYSGILDIAEQLGAQGLTMLILVPRK
jgi:hypothetical protein